MPVCALEHAASEDDDGEGAGRRSGRKRKPKRDAYLEEEQREEARKAAAAASGELMPACLPAGCSAALHMPSGLALYMPFLVCQLFSQNCMCMCMQLPGCVCA